MRVLDHCDLCLAHPREVELCCSHGAGTLKDTRIIAATDKFMSKLVYGFGEFALRANLQGKPMLVGIPARSPFAGFGPRTGASARVPSVGGDLTLARHDQSAAGFLELA